MSLSIKMEGVDDLRKTLKAWELQKRGQIAAIVAETALNVETQAKQLAPVDTGRLRSSIHHELAGDALGAEVVAATDYAAHVEFGTRHTGAQPYMTPAAEAERPKFIAKVGEVLND